MLDQLDNMNEMTPLSRVQREIADLLRADEWIRKHRIEIVEQNSQALSFVLQKSISQVNNVVVIVGTDEMTNNPPVLEAVTTVSATENVVMNRQGVDYASALDVMQKVIDIVDGREWKFEDMRHDAPTQGVLQATATFRGQVTRTMA